MQFVKTADLTPGMRLAKPIYNKMGVLLYERDTKLTIQGINSIQNFGLIGIFILEPAEPLPPLSKEDLEFEQFQTIYMFQLKDTMDAIQNGKEPDSLIELVSNIQTHYGSLDHKVNFTQTLRSSADFVYKHSISVAILAAMIANRMHIKPMETSALITATLLYKIGYLYIPVAILDKGNDLEQGDLDFIQLNMERGYEVLRPAFDTYNLPLLSLEIIQQIIFSGSTNQTPKAPSMGLKTMIDIIKAAEQFDLMTAMNINKPPVSEMTAMIYLRSHRSLYNPKVVGALGECVHILPTGACVDLSDGEKALVLVENPADFSHPMVLKFSDNQIYDLSDPAIAINLRITDIMKTMDNRIAIDEETLKQFKSDKYIMNTAAKFQKKKQAIVERETKKAASAAKAPAETTEGIGDISSLIGVSSPIPAGTAPGTPAKKAPAKRMKLR